MLRIGIVAGEASGDQLGAGLIHAIRNRRPDASFEGIAGPQMIAAGCRALFPAEKLAVMGLVEVLKHYPGLRSIRARLLKHFCADPPDVFVGIDAPDFNLGLERRLKSTGIKTVHYVSPSVWAWRQSRVKTIVRSTDLMLTLFPFEAEFYRHAGVDVAFVGHPLADMIPLETEKRQARAQLGLPVQGDIVALLPGSRLTEVGQLSGLFITTAVECLKKRPKLHFVVPFVSPATREYFENVLAFCRDRLPITIIDGRSRDVMTASDVVLTASGTATLEAMLLKRPMVVAYRLAPASYFLLKRLVKIKHYSLPNLLAGRELVPEYIQERATAGNLAAAVLDYFNKPERIAGLMEQFLQLHMQLRQGADSRAADAVLQLIDNN